MLETVSRHFTAAFGVQHEIDRAVDRKMAHFYQALMREYRDELKLERARMMRETPTDYRAVRALDRTIEDITWRMQEFSCRRQG